MSLPALKWSGKFTLFGKPLARAPPQNERQLKCNCVGYKNTSNIIIKTNSQIININEFRAEEQSHRSHFAYNKAIWFSYHKLKMISLLAVALEPSAVETAKISEHWLCASRKSSGLSASPQIQRFGDPRR